MTDAVTRQRPIGLEEYLRLEEGATVRHEYVDGEVHALAGASLRHNRIVGNIHARLWAAARGGPSRVYVAAVRLRAAPTIVYYPDVMVACGPEGDDPLVEHAPCLVVEVLSPSTEHIDRREKALVYKALPGLRAYVVVHQALRRVERHWRDDDGTWWHVDVAFEGRVPLPCPELVLTLDEIYEGVTTDPAGGATD